MYHVVVNADLVGKNVIQINGGITKNVDVSVKKSNVCEKDYICNPATWSWKNGKYLASIMNNSAIMCVEIIQAAKTLPSNFTEKKQPVKHKTSIFYLHFYQLV